MLVLSWSGNAFASEDSDTEESIISEDYDRIALLPAVTDLTAERTKLGVRLKWSAPDETRKPGIRSLEGFENAEPFSMSFDDWKFIDVDKSPVGSFKNSPIPGIKGGSTSCAFVVFDTSHSLYKGNNTVAASEGYKYIVSLFRADAHITEDWVISPELDGIAQTVIFSARSYHPSFPENFKFYYSSTTNEIEDFIMLGEPVDSVPAEWTEYRYQLPDDAKYFAIKSSSADAFMLMLDGFSFVSKNSVSQDILEGYEIYRDNELLSTVGPETLTHFDSHPVSDDHQYSITAVYTLGKSVLAEAFEVRGNTTGVADIEAGDAKIYVSGNDIVIEGLASETATVTSADGRIVAETSVEGKTAITVTPGIYIVKTPTHSQKVIVTE